MKRKVIVDASPVVENMFIQGKFIEKDLSVLDVVRKNFSGPTLIMGMGNDNFLN